MGGAGPAGRHGRGGLAAAGSGHLGGTQRRPGLHLLRGDVPGGAGPGRGHRRTARPARTGPGLAGSRRQAAADHPGPVLGRGCSDAERASWRRRQPGRQPAGPSAAAGPPGRPPAHGGHRHRRSRTLVGRGRFAVPLLAPRLARRHRGRRGRLPAVQLLAGREPGHAGPARRGPATLCLAVRESEPARPAARADRPVDGRVHRQLPAGVQPHWHHRQRRDSRPIDQGHGRSGKPGGDVGMIDRLAIFGATGDLTARYLLPGLAALQAAGQLGDRFQLAAAGRQKWDTEVFRQWAAAQLDRHGGQFPAAARQAVVSASSYHEADVADLPSVASVIAGGGPVAAYLALPPAVFPVAVSSLHDAGLPSGSRIVLEKPFGEDLDSAVELNRLLAELVPEQAVFRVDHFLAMTTVQNVLGTRLANRMLEPVWDSTHIAEVDIVWDESLALEGRAGYYDGVGALKDMLQNHLLQLLCLVAMEPPISLGERDLRDRKLDVLRSVRPLTDSDVVRRTRRARYLAGRIGDRRVPAYVDEGGVNPRHRTETFAEIELGLDNWRWPGTIFRLRTGKALGRDRKEVAVRFRSVPHLPFGHSGEALPNVLRFGLDPESLTLDLTGIGSRAHTFVPLELTARIDPPELPAYGRLLLDVLNGNPALSIRGDEAEEAWRVVAPVLSAWSKDLVPLLEYPAGSEGPGSSQHHEAG